MAKMREEIRRIQEDRAKLDQQIQELEGRLMRLKGERAGLDRALAIVAGQDLTQELPERKERARGVKEMVLAQVQVLG